MSVRDFGDTDREDVASVTQIPSGTQAAVVSAANAAAVLTFAAVAGQSHRLTFLAFSYDRPNLGIGRLTVAFGATNVIDMDIPIAAATAPLLSPVAVLLPPGGLEAAVNEAITITLSAGGTAVIGKVSAAKLTG